MSSIKKILTVTLTLAMSLTMITGCGKKGGETSGNSQSAEEAAQLDRKTIELRQNDYRGGITRMQAVQDNVLKVMEQMKSNNIIIREDSPNSFWSAEGYQDFVATFLDTPIINDTCWFNEEEGDWQTTLQMMGKVENSFTQKQDDGTYRLKATVERNEKDDYTVTGVQGWVSFDVNLKKKYEGNCIWRVLYDCDKDWCKAYCTMTITDKIPDATVQMFEYMRVDDNTFIVQTSRERLMVVLKPVEEDTDLREREVKEFYYSKLVQEGMRTTYSPYEVLPEYDEATGTSIKENERQNELMAEYQNGINENGDLAVRYGQNDSVFYRSPSAITPANFVFEDKSLQQAISYKDGVLVVTTYNKLSKIYERFTYSLKDADTSIVGELEKLVEINNLVGIQEVPEIEVENKEGTDKKKNTTEKGTSEKSSEPSENGTDESNTEGTSEDTTEQPTETVTEATTEVMTTSKAG
ncbi:MAG: hypothetical protein IJK26_09130 [Clostridia bacterium]|nr:hypothetical protein [Clostridia bacterium]